MRKFYDVVEVPCEIVYLEKGLLKAIGDKIKERWGKIKNETVSEISRFAEEWN